MWALGNTAKHMKRLCMALIAATAAAMMPAAALAATSADFDGSLWMLTYGGEPIATTSTTETFQISLTVDADGYSGSLTHIDQVGFEAVRGSVSFLGASLVSAPFGTASWELVLGNTTGNGCEDSSNGALCANSVSVINNGVPVPTSGAGVDYSWIFDMTVSSGGLETDADAAQVRARFAGPDGAKQLYVGQLTLIPEPQTYALLLAGLVLLLTSTATRRRR